MYRRGLPVAVAATLVLAAVYWVLISPSVPSASPSALSTAPAEVERASGREPSAKPPSEPLVRSLQPAAQLEPVKAKEWEPASPSVAGSGTPSAPALGEPPVTAPRVQALPPGPHAAQATPQPPPSNAAAAGKLKAAGAATPARPGLEQPAAIGARSDLGDAPNRPGFLRKLDSQDYGGRE